MNVEITNTKLINDLCSVNEHARQGPKRSEVIITSDGRLVLDNIKN